MIYIKEYPATERQISEWEYACKTTDYVSNLSCMMTINNPDYYAIENTFEKLIARHESLRTTFSYSNGILKQILHDIDPLNFKIHYYNEIGQDNQNVLVKTICEKTINAKSDLINGPLFKVIVIKTKLLECKICIITDHIISDAMSMEILKKEFNIFYEAFKDNKQFHLNTLNFQMKDYAIWENEINASNIGIESLRYWNNNLRGRLKKFTLKDKKEFKQLKNMSERIDSGGIGHCFFENELLEDAKYVCKNQLLVIMTTISVWLSFISNKKDIILAIPFSARDTMELQNVIGYLMIGVYLRVDINIDLTFKKITNNLIETYSQALTHRNYSRRSLSIDIDQYCSAFINNFTYIENNEEFKVSSVKHKYVDKTPYYPLSFSINKYKNGWLLSCHYKVSLFKNKSFEHLFEQYYNLALELITKPHEEVRILLTEI